MSSPDKQVFSSQELQVMDLALAGALATMQELGLDREGLEEKLRKRLFVVAKEGVDDPRTLRNKLLDTIGVRRTA